MNPILKNVLAVIAGLVAGAVVNGTLVNLGPLVIPPPEGADITTMEGLKETMHLFKPANFLFPFLAHALGTLVGAVVTAFIAVNHKMKLALLIGAIFLIGGIIMVVSVPSPTWFSIVDLVGAYIPMGWLGGRLVAGKN
jgi:hypothetical protein